MVVKAALKEKEVNALINEGAPVKKDAKSWVMVNVRISAEMLDEVDQAVDDRVGITRTGWILEAIHEKLKGS